MLLKVAETTVLFVLRLTAKLVPVTVPMTKGSFVYPLSLNIYLLL